MSTAEFNLETAEGIARAGGAIEQLRKSEGWQILMTLYNKRKEEIKDKDDYTSLEDFKADRRALEIVDGLLVEIDDIFTDAQEAVMGISEDEQKSERGIMLIEGAEDINREA